MIVDGRDVPDAFDCHVDLWIVRVLQTLQILVVRLDDRHSAEVLVLIVDQSFDKRALVTLVAHDAKLLELLKL